MPLTGPLILLLVPFFILLSPLLLLVGGGAWALVGLNDLGIISLPEIGAFLDQIILSVRDFFVPFFGGL